MIALGELLQLLDEATHGAGGGASCGLLVVRLRKLRDTELLYGHDVGEALCSGVPERVRDCVRSVDRVIRIGEGDCAVILPGIRDPGQIELAASRVARMFMQPMVVNGLGVRALVTVGGAAFPTDATTPEELLMAADLACARARLSRHRYELARSRIPGRRFNYDMLQAAVHDNKLQLYLQPIHSTEAGQPIRAFESLARWPFEGGFVPPAEFIPIAERGGLIQDLTLWSLNSTLRHLAQWRAFSPDVQASINISPLFAADPAFPDLVARALSIWDMPPEALMLEITETAFAENAQAVIESMLTLKRMGVCIAIDDFGTGYASFGYLKDFPVSELKIDQAFICDLVHQPRLQQLVGSMIDMARRLDITEVAEGVEDAETLALLTRMGCKQVQGFHLGRPQPAEEAVAALQARVAA